MTSRTDKGFGFLSKREAEIVPLVARGFSNGEIGAALGIAVGTVKVHMVRIFDVTGVKNRTHLVAEYTAWKAAQAAQPKADKTLPKPPGDTPPDAPPGFGC